jgi:siroheme synthase-like protein
VAADAEDAGVWVNVADDPVACSFTLPALRRQGPLTLTVSTGGHIPALAGWLRSDLGDQIGPDHAVLARLLSEARDDLRAAGRSTEGADWRAVLESPVLATIRSGDLDRARQQVRECLTP